MPHYTIGSQQPQITPDAGAGKWCSEPASSKNSAFKAVLVPMLDGAALELAVGPEASAQMKHYMGNSGLEFHHNVAALIKKSHYLRTLFTQEVEQAKAFCEQLNPGTNIPICSTQTAGGYFRRDSDPHLFFAIGGFQYWGQGLVDVVALPDRYRYLCLKFEFHLYDRYNWDKGKFIEINTPWDGLMARKHRIDDEQLQEFHRQCLAQEYDVRGLAKQTFEWHIEVRNNPFDVLNAPNAENNKPPHAPLGAVKK